MNAPIDRESLREETRRWSELQRRMLIERAVELSDGILDHVFEGLVHLEEHRPAEGRPAPLLLDRVAAHIGATRRGDYLGELIICNQHGREPWQTAAWVAATWHLFDLALVSARHDTDAEALGVLRSLVGLVEEVDERLAELVVFEDDGCATLDLDHPLRQARALLQASG